MQILSNSLVLAALLALLINTMTHFTYIKIDILYTSINQFWLKRTRNTNCIKEHYKVLHLWRLTDIMLLLEKVQCWKLIIIALKTTYRLIIATNKSWEVWGSLIFKYQDHMSMENKTYTSDL